MQIGELLIYQWRSKRRVSLEHVGMKNISIEVFIFCLWTNWIHFVTCREIWFRERHYCRRSALDKICEIYTFDRFPHGWSGQKSFLACGHTKKKIELENNWTIFDTCVPNPFHGHKIKEKFFSTGSRHFKLKSTTSVFRFKQQIVHYCAGTSK